MAGCTLDQVVFDEGVLGGGVGAPGTCIDVGGQVRLAAERVWAGAGGGTAADGEPVVFGHREREGIVDGASWREDVGREKGGDGGRNGGWLFVYDRLRNGTIVFEHCMR